MSDEQREAFAEWLDKRNNTLADRVRNGYMSDEPDSVVAQYWHDKAKSLQVAHPPAQSEPLESERAARIQAQTQLKLYRQDQIAAGLCIDAALQGKSRPEDRWWDGRMDDVRELSDRLSLALNAERMWEQTMMEVIGEDGPKSFADTVRKLQDERDALAAQVDRLALALDDATGSLLSISDQAGKDEFMLDMASVRSYAISRAKVSNDALQETPSRSLALVKAGAIWEYAEKQKSYFVENYDYQEDYDLEDQLLFANEYAKRLIDESEGTDSDQ